ncbi:hypothetical protein [Burkholderia sp. WAC0059]|uniref:hypothetical protein n=1 Tax=Burkholderia sp. WAC0059 TaxID=2066022 RepID=UPI0011AFAC36|nr:hypothetical protein [Burkholderia sp. WAC0059]
MKNLKQDLLPCIPEPFFVQHGEKVGDYFFSPLRKFTFTGQGIKRWYAPRLAGRPEDGTGFAATNMGNATIVYEHVAIPPHQTVLVAHAFETMATRIYAPEPGTYFIAVSFTPPIFEGAYAVAVCANGHRIWKDDISSSSDLSRYFAFLHFHSPGFIDFSINIEKETQTAPCRSFIQSAIVRCEDSTGVLQIRCDDPAWGHSTSDIIDFHGKTSFQPVDIPAPNISVSERANIFEKEWTLSKEYIESQYRRHPQELVEHILGNEEPASLKYCIFMIPRSGSTFLTELLASSDKLGFPGESFVPDVIRTLSLSFSDIFSSYEQFLLSRLRSKNGVFGIEIEAERLLEEPDFFEDVKD